MIWSLSPLKLVDVVGCLVMLVMAGLCLRLALQIYDREPENALTTYLKWLIAALFAFCVSRSLGHLVRHLLYLAGHGRLWQQLSPLSGSINTISFIVIFAVTLFFRDTMKIMGRMLRDRENLEKTSRQVLQLNRDIEVIVADRTRAELALHVAHEIRNPVMVIGGLIRRLLGRGNRQDTRGDDERLGVVLEQTEKLESLINRFEELQSGIREHFGEVDLNDLMRQVLDVVKEEAAAAGIRLESRLAPGSLVFQGDSQLVRVAILHLVRNAIEVCGQGNIITLATGRDQRGVLLTISDDGPGIPEQVLEHIFEAFHETDAGPTGLGLPWVRQIIDEHRGTIDLASTPGRGTTVTITLPTHLGEFQHRPSA
ncbi:sensor histidine kinase [Desulfolithobacter sp.]